MAEFIHKPGTGSLLTNLKKTKDTAPDYNGRFVLARDMKAGDTLHIGCWTRNTVKGTILMLNEDKFRMDREQERKDAEASKEAQYPKELNDSEFNNPIDDSDVPF